MKIAIASCCKVQDRPEQPAWTEIAREEPDVLILLGDNVYQKARGWDGRELKQRYQQQFAVGNFARLWNDTQHFAVWDDNDFGANDVRGAEMPLAQKKRSRELFHEFLDCSTNRPHIYCSAWLGRMKLILLDGRFYRERSTHKRATILGEEQEEWFFKELADPGYITLIASGSCLTAGDQPWRIYPHWMKRFRKALAEVPRPLFLSGDIHRNQFVHHPKLNLFEVTSSGVSRFKKNTRKRLDNYGILDFAGDRITVRLRGNRKADCVDRVIRIKSWTLA